MKKSVFHVDLVISKDSFLIRRKLKGKWGKPFSAILMTFKCLYKSRVVIEEGLKITYSRKIRERFPLCICVYLTFVQRNGPSRMSFFAAMKSRLIIYSADYRDTWAEADLWFTEDSQPSFKALRGQS